MQIIRDKSIEQYVFDEIRRNMDFTRDGIHLSDLMYPRRAYWQKTKPLPPTDDEIMYWLTGQGHESAFINVSGYQHGEQKEWNGILYTPDMFFNFPVELKTRRGNLAKDGEEQSKYESYITQLRGYCALENITQGWLHVWSLIEGSGKTKPVLRSYRIEFSQLELDDHRDELVNMKNLLNNVLYASFTYFESLPLCPKWMCYASEVDKKPFCIDCNREFDTEWGLKQHIKSKKGEDHRVVRTIYKQVPKCKWYEWCKPEVKKGE